MANSTSSKPEWEQTLIQIRNLSNLYIPNGTFQGDNRTCLDPFYAQEKLFEPPAGGVDPIRLWLYSGALALFLAQFVSTNLVDALLKYVDPLALHDGLYLGPPADFYASHSTV